LKLETARSPFLLQPFAANQAEKNDLSIKQATQANGHSPIPQQLLSELAQKDLQVKLHVLRHQGKLVKMLACETMEEEVRTVAEAVS